MAITSFNDFLKGIKESFLLTDECIEFQISNQYAEDWNDETKCWEVEYKNITINYYLIHEIGHIYLAKETNYPYFARTIKNTEDIIQGIFDHVNAIVDCFVDNISFSFDGYYTHFLNYIEEALVILRRGFRFTNLHELMWGYLHYYLEFNYNLRFRNRRARQGRIERFLRGLKNIIISNSDIDLNRFKTVENELKMFSRLRYTQDRFEIIKFIFNILCLLNFWDKNLLIQQFELIFVDIDLSFLK